VQTIKKRLVSMRSAREDSVETQLRHDVCARLTAAKFSKITFVASTKLQWNPEVDIHVLDKNLPALHGDERPASICTQYLWWRFGRDAVLDSHLIDIWQIGTELFLFGAADAPRLPVHVKFPTYGAWAQTQRRNGSPELISFDGYAESLRQQVRREFGLNVQEFGAFREARQALIDREGYDPLEFYKEHLRNEIRRNFERQRRQIAGVPQVRQAAPVVDIPFLTFEQWTDQQTKLLGLESLNDEQLPGALALLSEEEYAQYLRNFVFEKFRLSAERYKTFLAQHGAPLARAGRNPIEMYKEYLRGFVRLELERQESKDGLEERAVPRAPREPTMAELGLLGVTTEMSLTPKYANGHLGLVVHGADTMSTLKEKISRRTGLPIDSVQLLRMANEVTRLEQLGDFRTGDVQFTVRDRRKSPRLAREDTLASLGLLGSSDTVRLRSRYGKRILDFEVNGNDTMSTLKERISQLSGIPLDSLMLLVAGQEPTKLEHFGNFQNGVEFSVVDRRDHPRREETLADVGILDARGETDITPRTQFGAVTITLQGTDTLSTIKQKLSNQIGILPRDIQLIVEGGGRVQTLADLRNMSRRATPFTIVDISRRQR
jgi:hypothetical protein